MTANDPTIAQSAWSWWEQRRLIYNLALFITGWVGWALLLAIGFGWDSSVIASIFRDNPTDLMWATVRAGSLHLIYMIAANVLFLLGPLLETLIKPEPVQNYRRRAWVMGLLVSVALPLIAAVNLGLILWDGGHG